MVHTSNIYTYPITPQPTLKYVDGDMQLFSILFMLGTMFLSGLTLYTYFFINNKMNHRRYKRYNELFTEEDMNEIPQEIGARMKFLERYTENNISIIPSTHSFIVKLDGRNFNKLLNTINDNSISEKKLPYSNIIKMAFEYTIVDLIKEFHATTGYNYMDKILLVFPKEKSHIFGGRVSKIHSVISSYTTSRFIVNLENILDSSEIDNVDYNNFINHEYCKISFVSSVVVFPDFNTLELVNYLKWHNDIIAPSHFNKHLFYSWFDTHNFSLSNLRSDLLTEYNIDYDSIDLGVRHGVFIKRQVDENNNIVYVKFIVFPKLQCNNYTYDFMVDKNIQEWDATSCIKVNIP